MKFHYVLCSLILLSALAAHARSLNTVVVNGDRAVIQAATNKAPLSAFDERISERLKNFSFSSLIGEMAGFFFGVKAWRFHNIFTYCQP